MRSAVRISLALLPICWLIDDLYPSQFWRTSCSHFGQCAHFVLQDWAKKGRWCYEAAGRLPSAVQRRGQQPLESARRDQHMMQRPTAPDRQGDRPPVMTSTLAARSGTGQRPSRVFRRGPPRFEGGCAWGGEPATGRTAPGAGRGDGHGAAGQLRPAQHGGPTRLRGPDRLGAARASRRGGRRAAAGGYRLAGRRDGRPGKGQPPGPAAAARRRRRGGSRLPPSQPQAVQVPRGVPAGLRAGWADVG